jgi:4-hydroxy-2-oxoheptanedioate aldolase
LRKNPVLAKLRAGRVSVLPCITFGSPDIVEHAAYLGFDGLWLDWQHGTWTEPVLADALARLLPATTAPIVRVRSHDWGVICSTLDMGAMGIIVPMVQNAEDARAAVQATKNPPLGRRSLAGVRVGLVAGEGSFDEYIEHANEEILLAVMVESEEAVANVRAIMDVPGVDAVFIGPGDLMLDVQKHGHDAAVHEQLLQQVADISKATSVAAGLPVSSREDAERRIAQGFRLISHGGDYAALMAGLSQTLEESRAWS